MKRFIQRGIRVGVPAFLFILPGCVTIPGGPIPFGKDTYKITTTDWLLGGPSGETLNKAIREAKVHCASMSKEFLSVNEREGNIHGQLIYRCLSADDPGYQRP